MRTRTTELQHLPGAVMGLAHVFSPDTKAVPEAQHAPVKVAGQRVRGTRHPNGGGLADFAGVPHFAALRSSIAARSCSSASRSMSRFSSARTARFAQARSSIDFSSLHGSRRVAPVHRGFLGAPSGTAPYVGASVVGGGAGRVHQEGRGSVRFHAFTFVPVHVVIQRVNQWSFAIEAPMQQTELRLLSRIDAPSVVPPNHVAHCKTYREAVQLCWQLRVRNITRVQLAEEAGLYPPHVTSYLNDDAKSMRDLPGYAVRGFEKACGNTAISQWHASNAKLTLLEEMQAMKALS